MMSPFHLCASSFPCKTLQKNQWIEEFRTEFASLFESCYREFGSLSETIAPHKCSDIVPLPPVVEKAFKDLEIMATIKFYPGCSLVVLKLYRST